MAEQNEILNYVYNRTTATLRVSDAGSDVQFRAAYDSNGNAIYMGYGVKGLDAGDDGWLVNKLTYDGNNNLTLKQSAIGAWDDRASLTYS